MTRPFHITLSPIRSDSTLHILREGEVLIVNGQPLDCSTLTDAADLGCDALVSNIVAAEGALRVTLLLPHGAAAEETVLFPQPLLLTEDGPARLPTDPADFELAAP